MSKAPLKSLVIEHLRGAVMPFQLTFEKGKKLSIIYGENGTGKSTICDALDFLGNGNVGSLDNRGLGKTTRYWHSLGRKPMDVSVTLEAGDGKCIGKLTQAGVVVNPSDKFPKVQVLRKNQILKLVEAKPAERYAAIQAFIDVSGVEDSEATLRVLIRDIEKDSEVALARVQENRQTIENFWEEAGKPDQDFLTWAALEITKDQSALDLSRDAIETLKSTLSHLLPYYEKYKTQLETKKNAENSLLSAQIAVNELNAKVVREHVEILEILQAAQRYLECHPKTNVCPLCESSEKTEKLLENVKQRTQEQVTALQLKAAQDTLNIKLRELEKESDRLEELKKMAIIDAEKFAEASKNPNLPSGIALLPLPYPVDLADWEQWLKIAPNILEKWRVILDSLAENKKFTNTLKASLEILQKNTEIQNELDNLLPRLRQTLAVVEEERKKFISDILQEIATEVGKLYEEVHPGESLNKISFELDPAKRASLEIAAEFQGQAGTPPQAYFSDSHLDTLGLCVFLALAKREAPEETVLVLDDVLASVDEPHVDRLIEMLYSVAMQFRQCIITTHYKPWKQKLKWGWLQNGQCQFIELNKWTSMDGISLTKSLPDIERLRSLLTEIPPDPQLICAKAGVILEAALDFLTQIYECHVPRRSNSLYTLGDLLTAIDKRLRAALRVEHKSENPDGTATYIEKQLAPHLDELTRIMQSRNVFGAHFNALSFELLDTDAIHFGSEVLALMDCLIDHENGWPKNNKSGSYWATAGETRRLHPLQNPR